MNLAKVKDALASFPSGVAVVTTRDRQGGSCGFTASSFCAVSLDPALVSVCLANSADCYPAFLGSDHFVINILGAGDDELAKRFATRGVDKFGGGDFVVDAQGMPLLRSAVAAFSCRKYQWIACGDHALLVGQIEDVGLGDDGDALIYYRRKFWAAGATRKPAAVGG